MSRKPTRQRAYTLVEMLAVLALLGLVATVVLPSRSVGDIRRLDLSAVEIANAMRFARSESIRTGVTTGFRHQSDAAQIDVFSIDTDASPATIEFDVYHPVDKGVYVRQFDQRPFAFNGTMVSAASYRGDCTAETEIYFDEAGTPWCSDPANVLLERFQVTLTVENDSRVITLQGITGRVTIQ